MKSKLYTVLLFGMNTHKKTKTTLEDLFQKLHYKEKISQTIKITINS